MEKFKDFFDALGSLFWAVLAGIAVYAVAYVIFKVDNAILVGTAAVILALGAGIVAGMLIMKKIPPLILVIGSVFLLLFFFFGWIGNDAEHLANVMKIPGHWVVYPFIGLARLSLFVVAGVWACLIGLSLGWKVKFIYFLWGLAALAVFAAVIWLGAWLFPIA